MAAHVKQRAREHYGLSFSDADVLRLNQKLWSGDAYEFSKPKRKGKRFFVEVERGRFIPVIYHTGRHRMVTVLSGEAAEVARCVKSFPNVRLVARPGFLRRVWTALTANLRGEE